jgi:hypothetical protein
MMFSTVYFASGTVLRVLWPVTPNEACGTKSNHCSVIYKKEMKGICSLQINKYETILPEH